jgi:xylose isomerase
MRTYLLLKRRAAAGGRDGGRGPGRRPGRPAVGAYAGRWRVLPGPPSRPDHVEDYAPDAAAQRGYGYVHLNQLALEHLLGARP